MGVAGGPDLIQDGLVLDLDASDRNSYVSGSTTWFDLSGLNNSGSLINGPTFNSTNGGSIVFDGTNDYVNILNPSILQNQNLTVSTWIKPTAATNVITGIIDYDHGITQGWVLQSEDATSNRNYYFAYYDGSTFQPSSGIGTGKGVQLTNSIWQNLIFTKNGTSIVGYLNSVQTYTSTASSGTIMYLANKNLWLGGVVSIAGRFYNGTIANTQIYNRALTAQEILQNYNAQKSKFGL
jgi:hypothetical protein